MRLLYYLHTLPTPGMVRVYKHYDLLLFLKSAKNPKQLQVSIKLEEFPRLLQDPIIRPRPDDMGHGIT